MGNVIAGDIGMSIPGNPAFLQRVLRGQVTGARRVVFSGDNDDIDIASVPEDLWGGTGLIPIPSTPESLEIVSSSADDTAAGIGARTVLLTTLDGDFNEITQTVIMNGITPVALTGTHLRLNQGIVATVGSNLLNVGTLTIRVAGGGADRGYITTRGALNQAKITAPAGHHIDLLSVVMSIRTSLGNENAVLAGATANSAGRTLTVVRFSLFAAGTSLYRHETAGGTLPFFTLTERSALTWRALSVSQNNTALDVATLAIQYDENYFPL